MATALVIIIALILIAATLAACMIVAWAGFGRPRHALVWASGFGVAALQWSIDLLLRWQEGDGPLLHAGIAAMSCLSNALIAIGFIQRGGGRSTRLLAVSAAIAALTAVAASFAMPHGGLHDSAALAFGAFAMTASALHVTRPPRLPMPPERAALLLLVLLALIDAGTAITALHHGTLGSGREVRPYETGLWLAHSTVYAGVGLFAIVLVAADLAASLRAVATIDLLTGLYNRRGFDVAAEREIRNAQRQGQPLSVILADVDGLATINRRNGRAAGDRALRHLAGRMERLVRRGDLIGRIDGGTFALLLVNARSRHALIVAERLRRDIAAVPVEGGPRITVSASFGVTDLRPGDMSLIALLNRADDTLRRSKREGGDQVTGAEESEAA